MIFTIIQDGTSPKILWEGIGVAHEDVRNFLGGMPYVYRIEDPEPDRCESIFGYNTPMQIRFGEIRYVGVSSAQDGKRIFQPRRNQPLLKNWFVHLANLGFGTYRNPLRVHIKTCVLMAEAFELERNLTNHYGLAKNDGRLLNQVEGGGQTYGYKHTPEAKEKMAAAKRGKKLSDAQKQKMSQSGYERANREKKTGACKVRGQKITQARIGKPHPHTITPEMREMCSELGKSMKGKSKSLSHRLKLSQIKCKLSDDECSEIVSLVITGERRKILADRYDVSKATIDNVVNGKYAPFTKSAKI